MFVSLLPSVSLALAVAIGMPAASSFHLQLKSSTPARDAVLRTAPAEIRLTFSARPELALSDIKLIAAGGKAVALGKVAFTSDSLTIAAPVEGPLPEGAYQVTWRTASKDGHPIRGTIPFTVAASAEAAAPGQPCASEPIESARR